MTIRDDRNALGNFDVSYGFDTETYINKTFTLLGDVSSFSVDGRNYADFGVGQQIKFGESSIVVMYGNRQNTNNYRLGYLLDNPGCLLAVLADYKEGAKPVYSGFLSLAKLDRFFASYDPNTKTFTSKNLLAFGNKELPAYAMVGFLKEQYILTEKICC